MRVRLSVIICAYTMERLEHLLEAADVVLGQLSVDDELLVIIDGNQELLDACVKELEPRGVQILANAFEQGLSGARNTGVSKASRENLIFLDDDAIPEPGWLEGYRRAFELEGTVGVGGRIAPDWEGGRAPAWFPEEFGWVVGCDYRGLPADGASIRNPMGANMGLRRSAILDVGGFSSHLGRVGSHPVGNEETEASIRIRQAQPSATIVRNESSVVRHFVPRQRQTVKYFVRRCYYEGVSKAGTAHSVGSADALSSERHYLRTLARGVREHLSNAAEGDLSGLARAAMVPAGLLATSAGYARGRVGRR